MPKINHEEYEILKSLDEKWKWIARNEDRCLYALTEKPVKKYGPSLYWDTETGEPYAALELFDERHLFQFIQWENEEPHNIDELIEEYESSLIKSTSWTPNPLDFESEETEVKKDIEWLKQEILKQDIVMDKGYIYTYDLMSIISEVDEPEVLSEVWIDEHKFEVNNWNNAVHVEDLQNLLVPKQELPVIPNYVSKWISVHHEQFDLYPALKRLESNALSWEDVYEWYRRNTHTFVKAYLSGKYEVEEEQKYFVDDSHRSILCKWDGDVISVIEAVANDLDFNKLEFVLTEQEIKDYDPRYFAFAKKVEELEE